MQQVDMSLAKQLGMQVLELDVVNFSLLVHISWYICDPIDDVYINISQALSGFSHLFRCGYCRLESNLFPVNGEQQCGIFE